jgi:hypothetical protein
MSMTENWSQLKIIEYQNKIETDEINTNDDMRIPYSIKKQILSTYE